MDNLSRRVKDNLEKSFRELDVSAEVSVDNFGNVRVEGDVNAWLRLYRTNGNVVDVNNIHIVKEKQKRRIFTNMMLNLRGLKTIDVIVVTSVSTIAMHCWCRKNGCEVITRDLEGNPLNYRYK